MVSFVDGIEKQAAESIVNYREKRRSQVVVENHPGGEFRTSVYVHQGLDGETWDLEGVFEEHFPSLQRRSALLTLCSYFEYELEQLCLLYQREKHFKLAPSDLRDTGGIDRSTTYLEKVAGLCLNKTESPEWIAIKRIQKLRNLIVHQDGKLRDENYELTNRGKEVMAFMGQMKFLKDGLEIRVEDGFLSYVLGIYNNYFQLIDASIKASENL
jgi:hypothetical protein